MEFLRSVLILSVLIALDALGFYERKLDSKIELSVAVLNKAQWEQVTKVPYDVLFAADAPHIAFIR